MPKRKALCQRTNSVQKKPLRDEQEQYRHSHGLSVLEISICDCFQIQMTAANHATSKLWNNIAGLLTLATVTNNDQLLKEAKVLKAM